MANPGIQQGQLNRLVASIMWNDFPSLNVTPSFMGRQQISLSFEGEATTFIKTATGVVISPEPFQMVSLTIHLLKTQFLAPLYEAQLALSSVLGNGTVRPDIPVGTNGLSAFQITNCGIQNVRELSFSGEDAGYSVVVGGYVSRNSGLWG